ncbi:sugar phosphate isomerase/epimerase family protein [Thalassotalea profundi]|uniref:Sugar phosphate isomerase n=1 Tax=Thalassotalea profundi TaxID=2036687 RepID=A0ABQ3J5B8_9GAMM|nr:sugar phosphate isomerase/epimerase [Thalassotalea profundi]GHF01391.1 sugar phosphate isomerase [Thalassotalea profundi]
MKKITSLLSLLVITLFCKSAVANAQQVPPLSVQLWSVKDEIKSDIKGTIKTLADMGFSGVEFANEFGEFTGKPEQLKSYLDSIGIKASGAHVSFESLNEVNFDKTIKLYKALGVDSLVIGWDTRAWHPQGIFEIVRLLNQLSKKLAPLNMQIGFHNHDHEFDTFNNSTYWDYLAKHTSYDVILQMDVGWVTYAGKDPIEYVKKYSGRTLSTHYKVQLPEGTKGKLPIIGKDTIDWLNLLKANMSHGATKWIIVEQEDYPNGLTPLQAVAESKKGLDKYIKQLTQ